MTTCPDCGSNREPRVFTEDSRGDLFSVHCTTCYSAHCFQVDSEEDALREWNTLAIEKTHLEVDALDARVERLERIVAALCRNADLSRCNGKDEDAVYAGMDLGTGG